MFEWKKCTTNTDRLYSTEDMFSLYLLYSMLYVYLCTVLYTHVIKYGVRTRPLLIINVRN